MVKGCFFLILLIFLHFEICSMDSKEKGFYLFADLPTELKQIIAENLNHCKLPLLSFKNIACFSMTNRENNQLAKLILSSLVKVILNEKNEIEKILPKLSKCNEEILLKYEEIQAEHKLAFDAEIKLLCHLAVLNFREVGDFVNRLCKASLKLFNTIENGHSYALKFYSSIIAKLLNSLIEKYEFLLDKQFIYLENFLKSLKLMDDQEFNMENEVKLIISEIELILNLIIRFKCWITIFCYNSYSYYLESYVYNYPKPDNNLNRFNIIDIQKSEIDINTGPLFFFKIRVSFDSGYCDGQKEFISIDKNLAFILNKYLGEKEWFRTNQNYF